MNSIDLAILAIMGISCIFGFIRGFTREILGLFTWAGAAAATYFTVPMAGAVARANIANPMIADGVTSFVLFIAFLIIFSIVSGVISNSVRESNLGGVDRSLGFAFGILRAALLICLAEIAMSTIVARSNQAAVIEQARFTPMIRRCADSLIVYMPDKIQEFILVQADKAVTSAVQNQLKQSGEQIQDALKQLPITPQPNATSPATPSGTEELSNNSEEDIQRTAESLALLKPKAQESKTKDGDYDKHQKRDLDRLIQTNQ